MKLMFKLVIKMNRVIFIIFFYFLNFKISRTVNISAPERFVRIEKFSQCPGKEHLPVKYKDVSLNQVGYNKVDVSATVIFNITYDGQDFDSKIELHKCASKADLNTCEYHAGVKLINACNNPISYSWLVKYTTDFPNSCPIPPGEYHIRHFIFDFDFLRFLPLSDSYWKTYLKTRKRNTLIECVYSEFNVQEVRRRHKH